MDPIDLAAVAAWAFVVAVVGGLAGLVLGNLRLPVVLLVASSPAAGAGANVAISGVSATAAAGAHARAGRVDWRLFWWMAPASVAGGIAGGLAAGVLPGRVLLAVIGLVVLYGAVEVARYRGPPPTTDGGGEVGFGAAAAVGFGVGVLGGLVGLILGSLRLPAMVRWVGVTPAGAVGTNAAVGMAVGVGGLIGHLPSGVDWDILGAGCAGGIPGAYLGAHLVGRLSERGLLQTISAVLAVSGAAMLVQAAFG